MTFAGGPEISRGLFTIYLTMLAAVVAPKYLKAQKVLSEHEKLLAE